VLHSLATPGLMRPMSVCQLVVSLLSFCILTPSLQAATANSPWLQYVGQYPVYPDIDYGEGEQADAIHRGEYLAKIGDCIACHTNTTEGSAAFAGGLPIPTPFGTFYSPNITPDRDTGLGNWTESDFVRAMHDGILADGSNAFPAFPYIFFKHVTPEDLGDIWAYLQALPVVKLENRDNTLPFPMDVRLLQYGWKLLFFYPHRNTSINDASQSPSWNRGAYLVEGLGHCSMCHTPMNLLGAQKKDRYLGGAFIGGYWAPDITREGLESGSRYQVAQVFSSGKLIDNAGDVRGPMADVVHDSLRYLTEADQLAIAEYLKTVKTPDQSGLAAKLETQPQDKRGRQVYSNVCILCHLNGEVGAPRIGDSANWERRIKDKSLGDLYLQAVSGFNNMPPRGACVSCSDADVIAAVNYMLQRSLNESQWRELRNPSLKLRQQSTSIAIGKRTYMHACSSCHDSGKDGAPVTGDRVAWDSLLDKNFDVVLDNALRGIGTMPARGGCATCSGSDIIAAVKYMVQQSEPERDLSLW